MRPVKIALASATPPAAHVGESYEFNLGALLSLDGPEGTEPGKVSWSVVSGEVPSWQEDWNAAFERHKTVRARRKARTRRDITT
jgi:hypothetical protein